MAEYNRFVSYLYAYENNHKTINNGFVRVETRNAVSSVYVNMKELYGSGTAYRVYMFQRVKGSLNGICLGSVEARQGGGEFLCKITKDNINNSGISLNEIAGIIILGENGRKYGTCWDDEPLDAELFAAAAKAGEEIVRAHIPEAFDGGQPDENELTDENAERSAEDVSEGIGKTAEDMAEVIGRTAEDMTGTSERTVEKVQETKGTSADDIFVNSPQSPIYFEEISTKQSDAVVKEADSGPNQGNIKELMAESIALSVENPAEAASFFSEPLLGEMSKDDDWDKSNVKNKMQTIKKRLEKILNGGIKMYPFEDSEVESCIRLEIQDIGMLPMKYWFYAGNSFVLQSYYSYRHLILAKRIDGSYILGVPGLGEKKDSFIARRFGFNYFKSIREKSDEIPASNFGYWYVKLI